MNEFLATVAEWVVAGGLLLGAGFMLLAAVGLIRLPDLPTRMHASTKAGSLGAALTMLAVAVFLPEPAVIARAMATVAFLLLTAPVAAHAIGRAAYFVGVPLWEGTVKDDLAGHYDLSSHGLDSGEYAADEETLAGEAETKPAKAAAQEDRPVAGPDPVEGVEEPEEVVAPEPAEPVSDPDLEPEEEILKKDRSEEVESSDKDESSEGEESSEEQDPTKKESKKKEKPESSGQVEAEAEA